MHKGRPFELEQTLRPFAANALYSTGWAAKAYSMTIGTYTGSAAIFVTTPTPDLVLVDMDTDGLGGSYRGRIAPIALADLEVGFHFRFNSAINQTEAWAQCWFNGQRALFEPAANQNHIPYAWDPVSFFPLNPGGPFANQIRPVHVEWSARVY